MKSCEGIWLPDSERHLVEMLRSSPKIDGRATHQYHKLDAALRFVRQWRCAVDVGMHVGLWSMHLAKRFKTVIGFEPVYENIECLRMNMNGLNNYEVHNCLLGNRKALVGLTFMDGSTGSTQVLENGGGFPMCRLDDFEFENVDFLKIDVEGYEPFVIEGGEKTIKKHKPVIIVEQKMKGNKLSKNGTVLKSNYGKEQYAAKQLLESWGAKPKFEMAGDFCLSWH